MAKQIAKRTTKKDIEKVEKHTIDRRKRLKNETLRELMKREHNFDVLLELMYLFKDQKRLYEKLKKNFENRFSQGRPIAEIFGDAEYRVWQASWDNMFRILSKTMNFQFPRLKTVEIKDDREPVLFNIWMGDSPEKKRTLINVSPPQKALPYLNSKNNKDDDDFDDFMEGEEMMSLEEDR